MICITGGGTGGHLAIAKTLATELNSRGIKCIFIGSQKGQDRAWFENSELFSKTYFLPSSGVVDKKRLKKFLSLLNILKLIKQCHAIFKKDEICAVISVGGYSSASASMAGVLFAKPLFLHEQNVIIGRLNALLKPFAKGFFSSYFEPKYDYPIDKKFFEGARIRKELKQILFLGGSQGASFINSLALNLAPSLNEMGIKISHQSGEKEFGQICKSYEKLGIQADVFAFSKDMPRLMNKADICVSRAGASSLWELSANALPCVFIPYAHAASDHQYHNAKFLSDLGLCVLKRQNEIDAKLMLDIIKNMNLEQISKGLQGQISSGGASKIIDFVLENIKK